MFLDCNFNSKQTDNGDYDQYLSENETNYATYGRNSIEEQEESYITYGRDGVQESFAAVKICSSFRSNSNVKKLGLN